MALHDSAGVVTYSTTNRDGIGQTFWLERFRQGTGDTVLNQIHQPAQPEGLAGFRRVGSNIGRCAEIGRGILQRAAHENWLVSGGHVEGFRRVVKKGAGYELVVA